MFTLNFKCSFRYRGDEGVDKATEEKKGFLIQHWLLLLIDCLEMRIQGYQLGIYVMKISRRANRRGVS